MFEWFTNELASIQTPRFHVVDGPADSILREAVAKSNLSFPTAYLEFVLRFGNAKLYRQSRCGYKIGVFAGPRESRDVGGIVAYKVGFHDGSAVYLPANDKNSQVYEGDKFSGIQAVGDFEEWLATSCEVARKTYDPEKWSQIMRGPAPFTAEEQRIIETRKHFEWKVLEINTSGDRVIQVTNRGSRVLPALTIGVRSTDGRLNGAVRLKVDHVNPGQTVVLHIPCYKELYPPEQIETFSLPDPQPEDREYYAEFGVGRSRGAC